MISPVPWHVGQVVVVCICPRKVLRTCLTTPFPPQVPQVDIEPESFAPDPWQVEHLTCFFTLMVLVTPEAISSRVSDTFIRRLEPLLPRLRCPSCPPKKV